MTLKNKIRIISWNVNGLRAVHRKGKWQEVVGLGADILCVQETKSTPEQLDEIDPTLRHPDGYVSFFDYPKVKKGYSGVAIYTKVKPKDVQYIMGNPTLDNEGRLVAAYFDDFALMNVYFPNGGGGPERLKFKLNFYKEFLKFVEKTRKKQRNIIITGDVNTAHKEIDLARPKENEENTGFLPVERAWIDELLEKGYVDTFRHFNPKKIGAYTYWDMKTFARDRNVGWRIDYFFVTKEFLPSIKNSSILDNIFGSDHCPISLEISLK